MGWVSLVAGMGVERFIRLLINIREKVLERVVMVVKVALDVETLSVVKANELECQETMRAIRGYLTSHDPGIVQLKPRYVKLPRPG